MTIYVANTNEDSFDNLSQDATKLVHISGTNRYYLALTAKLVEKIISGKIGTVYDCYIG